MANLTQNLAILQKGKEDIIGEINSKLKQSDQEALPVDCTWADIDNLLDKVNVKKDRSAEIDTNKIYSDICSGEFNKEIVTGVTTITAYSMYGQKYLPKITANNCTSVGDYAFYDCQSLTEANLPNISKIPNYCFYNNSSLKVINAGNTTTIGDSAFYNCVQLEEINLPKAQTLGASAFRGCTNLKNIILNPENTYTISSYTFYDCVNLATDIATNAKAILDYGLYNTGVLEIDSNNINSLGTHAISHNSKLERISLTKLTALTQNYSIDSNNELTSINLSALTVLGQYNNNTFQQISNNPKLESIYWPNLTTWYGGGVYNCAKVKTLNLPSLDIGHKTVNQYEYTATIRIAVDCAELETIDLGKLSCIRQTTWIGTEYLIDSCYKLKYLNLNSLTCCNPTTEQTSSYSNYFYYCHLLYRVGVERLSLPALKWINPYSTTRFLVDCRYLNKLELPVLTSLTNNSSTWTSTTLLVGCPQLTELELPNLTKYYGSRMICGRYSLDNDSYSGDSYKEYNSKKYIEAMLSAIMENYPDTYETRSDYIRYYERRYGGIINGDLGSASPYNTGQQSSMDYNMQWCGLRTIRLPKLSSWTYNNANVRGIFKGVQELEELYLGDGTFTPTTTSLDANFVNSAISLKKVVLNYPTVITASTSLTSIFYDCGHLTGTKYSFSYNSKYYYYENEEGLHDLYFYVPDELVDSYKAATNWSTYADQIRPISELADLNIDPSITKIADAEYKDNQTLTSVAGRGITEIGIEGFRGSSASYIEFENCANVGKYAFADCPNLKKVKLKYGQITTIAEGVFMNSPIGSCNLPAATVIGPNAFKNTQVEHINAPELITINDYAFEGNNLVEISMSKATFIGNSAFKSNTITSVVLPEVTTIGRYAFADNNVQEVSMPKVIIIDDYAFANNVNLGSINLGTVRILGNNIFDGCTSLTDITFEGYAVPTGTLPAGVSLHVREELVTAFEEAYPNNTIIGDVK